MVVALLILAVIVGLILFANWVLTNATLKPPKTPLFLSPRDMDIPYEEMDFQSEDGTRLRGWWLPAREPVGIAVLCHGYLMNRSEPLSVARGLWKSGFHCLVFDFRAAGRSDGVICTIGHKEAQDALAAVQWAAARAPELPIVAYGASMGGAAVIMAAAREPRIQAVVADSAYCRLNHAVDDWWDKALGKLAWLTRPTQWLGTLITKVHPKTVAPESHISAITPRPVLIIHGTRDTLLKPYHAERLFAAAQEPKRLWWAQGSDHVQARFDHPDQFYSLVTQFFRDAVATKSQTATVSD